MRLKNPVHTLTFNLHPCYNIDMKKEEIPTGPRIGRLTIVRFAYIKYWKHYYECTCTCGNTITTSVYQMQKGKTVSCGCYNREMLEKRRYRHGYSRTPLYHVWNSMKMRCTNP